VLECEVYADFGGVGDGGAEAELDAVVQIDRALAVAEKFISQGDAQVLIETVADAGSDLVGVRDAVAGAGNGGGTCVGDLTQLSP